MSTLARDRKSRWLEVLKISWPLIIANGFWNLQLTIDRVFLGNYSTDALGAAVAVMGVFWTPMALLQQTAAYAMTFVAQYLGAKQDDRIGAVIWQAIHLSIAGGLLFLLAIPLAPWLFAKMGHSPQMQPLEAAYFQSLTWSALPAAVVAAASAFFTGLGRSHVIMYINAIGLIANAGLDWVLIFGKLGCPPLGIAGAGYATAIANYAAAFFAVWLLLRRENETTYKLRSAWRLQLDLVKRFLRFGLPSGLQYALEGLAFTVFLIIVGQMQNGDAALAASGIGVTIMMLAVLPALGFGQGVSVLVGQYLGSNDPERARLLTWSGVQLAATYIVSVGVTFALFPEFYLRWFENPENATLWESVSTIVPILLLFVAFFTVFDSMNIVFAFALKGAGDTRFVTLVALTLPWPLMVLPTYLLRERTDSIYYAWGACSVFVVVQATVFWRRFVGGRWQSMRVI